ncbi:MAG: hypothetical protein DRJ41_04815, partial [Thermoprotei archaeon]
YAVPIYMYPVLLGIAPILSLLYLHRAIGRQNKGLMLLTLASVFFLLFAKLSTLINISLSVVFYFERRILSLVFMMLTPLTAAYIRELAERKDLSSRLALLAIFLAGSASTLLTIAYWHIGLKGF